MLPAKRLIVREIFPQKSRDIQSVRTTAFTLAAACAAVNQRHFILPFIREKLLVRRSSEQKRHSCRERDLYPDRARAAISAAAAEICAELLLVPLNFKH